MLEENKKGLVGAWEVIVVVVILTLIGFVVWRAIATNNSETMDIPSAEELSHDGDENDDTDEGSNLVEEYREISYSAPDSWQIFESEFSGYTIRYPQSTSDCDGQEWLAVEGSANDYYSSFFGPPCSSQGGYLWGISIFPSVDLEQEISLYGDQFADREESRENITVNGTRGILVTVTTQEYPDWTSRHAIFSKDVKSYSISNGAVERAEFEMFVSSFRFVD